MTSSRITDTAASGHPWATQSHAYTNDLIDRLLTESATTPGNSTFAYDNLDNATTWNTPASGSLSPTFNGLNQISNVGQQHVFLRRRRQYCYER